MEYTLVIPDVHENLDLLDSILKRWDFIKKKTFLGDWLDTHDSFDQSPKEVVRVLIEILNDPNNTYLLGNHDLHYLFSGIEGLYCSGYQLATAEAVREQLKPEHRERMMRLHQFVETDGKTWMLSHAGVHPNYSHPVKGLTKYVIDQYAEITLDRLKANGMTSFLVAGKRRGGPVNEIGGITWLDFRDFKPVEGLNQIVGHTRANEVRTKTGPDSVNYCIDTGLANVAIISPDGQVTIEST